MKKKIVIADDHLDTVQSMKEMLFPYCEVDTATTGLETLILFKAREYDGLIIDVAFEGGMSGLETASRLRSKHKGLKILIFSATNYSDADRQQAVDIGATFREKPLSLDDVRKIMEI